MEGRGRSDGMFWSSLSRANAFIHLTTLANKSRRLYVKAPGLVQVQHRNRHIDVRALNPRPTTFRPRCGATRPPPNPTMTKTCALDAGQEYKYTINQDLKRFGTKNPCSVPHPTPPPPTPCILSLNKRGTTGVGFLLVFYRIASEF